MSTPTDIARRAVQATKRQERETKRRYEFLAGRVRSQLRKQLDEIIKLNAKAFILLLLEGGALKVGVDVAEKPPEPVIDEQGLVHTPIPGDTDNGEIVSLPDTVDAPNWQPPKPLIEIVP